MDTLSASAAGYVFVSHAAPDKLTRIKPLARALLLEGVRLWLDRPGVGESHFGFDDAFIRCQGIRGLNAGEPWDDGIVRALRECDAVLLCLSRHAAAQTRQVLQQEATSGRLHDNLVACIVDDLAFGDLPADSGLAAIARTQCERVDTAALEEALAWLGQHADSDSAQLPAELQEAWEPVRSLRRHLEQASARGRRLAQTRGDPPATGRPQLFMAPPYAQQWVERPQISERVMFHLVGDAEGARVVLLHGLPGAGKTSLARKVANDARVHSRFVGGVLWAELGQEPDLLARVQAWVAVLDDKASLTGDLAALAAKAAELLRNRPPCLLVVDDVWEAQHLQPLAVTWPHCRVLVTARREHVVAELDAAVQTVPVGPLTPQESLALLRLHMGERWEATGAPRSYRPAQVASALGHLAEALKLLAARVRTADDWERLYAAIGAEVAALDALATARERLRGESRLEAMVHISLRALRADSTLAYETFLRLGLLHEDAEFGAPVVARFAGLLEAQAESVLQALAGDALLLAGALPGRWRLHDVLRHVALRLLERDVSQAVPADGLPGLGLCIATARLDFVQRMRPVAAPWHTLAADGYSHEHLLRHLQQAGAIDELHRLLAEDGASAADPTAPPGDRAAAANGWFVARERLGQTAGYLADLARAQALAGEMSDTLGRNAGYACRYALMRASLRSIAGNIPPALLARLVALGRWSVAQALAYFDSMSPSERFNALPALAPHLDTSTCSALLRVARRCEGDALDWYWLREAAVLLPGLEAGDRKAAWREVADELLRKLSDVMAADIVQRLVPAGMPQSLANELFDAAMVRDAGSRLLEALAPAVSTARLDQALLALPQALPDLVPALAARGPVEARRALRLLLAAARKEPDAAALAAEKIAPHLSSQLVGRAHVVAKRSTDLGTRLDAEVALLGGLDRLGCSEPARRLMAEALEPFAAGWELTRVWGLLAVALAPDLQPSEMLQLLDSLQRIKGEPRTVCDVLEAISPQLPKEALPLAREVLARHGGNDGHWARPALFEAGARHQGFGAALQAAAALANSGERAEVLVAIAPLATEANLDDYLQLADALTDESDRAKAVNAIAPSLPPSLAPRALHIVCGVRDEPERTDAEVTLAAHLPAAQHEALIERVEAEGRDLERSSWRRRLLCQLDAGFWQSNLDRATSEPDEERRAERMGALLDAAPDAEAVARWLDIARRRREGAWLDAAVRLIELGATDAAWALTQQEAEVASRNQYRLGSAVVALAPCLPSDALDAACRLTQGLLREGSEDAIDAAAELAVRLVSVGRDTEAWALLQLARNRVNALLAPQLDGSRRLNAPSMRSWPAALEALADGVGIAATDVVETARWIPRWHLRAEAEVRVHARLGRPLDDDAIELLAPSGSMLWWPRQRAWFWADTLPAIAPVLGAARSERLVARAFERERSEGLAAENLLSMVEELAPWWSRGQLEPALALCRSARKTRFVRAALGALLRRAIALEGFGFALVQLRASDIDHPGELVALIAPAVDNDHAEELFAFSLSLRPEPERTQAIRAVAQRLARLPDGARAAALLRLLSTAESWPRPALVQALAAFAPALASQDSAALQELAAAIVDVGRWWP